jgi:hypothetical protein
MHDIQVLAFPRSTGTNDIVLAVVALRFPEMPKSEDLEPWTFMQVQHKQRTIRLLAHLM